MPKSQEAEFCLGGDAWLKVAFPSFTGKWIISQIIITGGELGGCRTSSLCPVLPIRRRQRQTVCPASVRRARRQPADVQHSPTAAHGASTPACSGLRRVRAFYSSPSRNSAYCLYIYTFARDRFKASFSASLSCQKVLTMQSCDDAIQITDTHMKWVEYYR